MRIVCTLILAWQVFDGVPIVAAANRDEVLDRPSSSPAVLESDPVIVAPRDEVAGGTWIGYNEHGLFVAITNRRADVEGERSRGLLVRDGLRHRCAVDAVRFVEREVRRRIYSGFNLVVADASTASLVEWDGRIVVTPFEPGVHVVVNAGHQDTAREAMRLRDALWPKPGGIVRTWLELVSDVLRDHEFGACVHEEGYGTRSSSLIEVDVDGRARYRYADGPPCETSYEEMSVDIENVKGQR